MDNIIYHTNHIPQTSFPTNLTAGCINPLRRTAYHQIVNINSRFRDDYYITPSTDFFVTIPGLPNKITSMRLIKVTLPKFIYTVNYKTGSDNFYIKIDSNQGERLFIPSGSYSGQQISEAINKQLNQYIAKYGLHHNIIQTHYSVITGKICFNINWSLNINEVTLCFNYVEPCKSRVDCSGILATNFCKNDEIFSQKPNTLYEDQLTLGWLLGFRGQYVYRTPKVATTDPTIGKFLTTGIDPNKGLSRKQLKNLSNITPRRARLTEVKNNGMQYLEQTYNCCDPSGQMFESRDISFCYTIQPYGNVVKPPIITTDPSNNFCAESIYDPIGNRYFLLSINDFQNNHTRALISPMQDEALHDSHILGKLYGPCCDCYVDTNPRIYFGPTSINRLHIKLLDEFGRIVDLNNGDFSFSLELEILYDL
tara:strand:- start:32 stop:1300 length:1269 start_codon:yes stop_codon:yes gene_type:complete